MDKNTRTTEPLTINLKHTPYEYALTCTPEELESQLADALLGNGDEAISYETALSGIKEVMSKNVKVTGGLDYTLD